MTQYINSGTAAFVQAGAAAALTQGEPLVAEIRGRMKAGLDLAYERLSQLPGVILPEKPRGGMYAFFAWTARTIPAACADCWRRRASAWRRALFGGSARPSCACASSAIPAVGRRSTGCSPEALTLRRERATTIAGGPSRPDQQQEGRIMALRVACSYRRRRRHGRRPGAACRRRAPRRRLSVQPALRVQERDRQFRGLRGRHRDRGRQARRHGGRVIDLDFQALFAATLSGRIDVAISSITITRSGWIQSFTQPYYDADMGIAAKRRRVKTYSRPQGQDRRRALRLDRREVSARTRKSTASAR